MIEASTGTIEETGILVLIVKRDNVSKQIYEE